MYPEMDKVKHPSFEREVRAILSDTLASQLAAALASHCKPHFQTVEGLAASVNLQAPDPMQEPLFVMLLVGHEEDKAPSDIHVQSFQGLNYDDQSGLHLSHRSLHTDPSQALCPPTSLVTTPHLLNVLHASLQTVHSRAPLWAAQYQDRDPPASLGSLPLPCLPCPQGEPQHLAPSPELPWPAANPA